jgi:hypothetical protein
MLYDVRFDDRRPQTTYLARNVTMDQATAVTRRSHAEARAKGLKVVKVPPREDEVYVWEHVDALRLNLPPQDLGRISIRPVKEASALETGQV